MKAVVGDVSVRERSNTPRRVPGDTMPRRPAIPSARTAIAADPFDSFVGSRDREAVS
jgi:hypothetical protein